MMKKIIFGVLAMATLFCGCSKDDIENLNSNTDAKGAINFSIGTTRTQYDSDDAWQLEWVSGDQIYIYSPQALSQAEAEEYLNGNYSFKNGNGNGTTGTYSVTPIENTIGKNESPSNPNGYTTNNLGSLTAANNPLYWSAGDATDGRHDFYAAYPVNSNVTACTKDGIITFKYNTNQVCKVGSDDVVAVGATVVAKPDMTNAYMVAAREDVSFTDESIDLAFKPIMTTLDITAQGANAANVNIDVTGITITTKLDGTEGIYLNDKNEVCFDVDANTGEIVTNVSGKTYMSGNLNTYITVKGNTNNYVGLAGATTNPASLTVTAFLPPIALKSPNSLESTTDNPIKWTTGTKFALHFAEDYAATGGNGVVTTSLKSGSSEVTIAASAKKKLKLPLIKTPIVNNWMSLIDDDVYVSQLSIPGTHDAATDDLDQSLSNAGQTQALSITQQLNMGIRAFDFRPVVLNDGSLGNISHGLVSTEDTLANVFKEIGDYLDINPSEFVIVILRNETGDRYPLDIITNQGGTEAQYNTAINNFLNTDPSYTKHAVSFATDLTLGEVRNKILVLCRDNGAAANGAAHVQWSHNQHPTKINIGGVNSLYVQDVFSPNEMCSRPTYGGVLGIAESQYYVKNGSSYTELKNLYPDSMTTESRDFSEVKPECVMINMDIAAKFHTEKDHVNIWMINHCSGYTGANNYPQNAHDTNLPVYEYLMGEKKSVTEFNDTFSVDLYERTSPFTYTYEFSHNYTAYDHTKGITTSKQKDVGSTGIMMLDFVGARSQTYMGTTYTVNGDLLPQAIIDNNFKYTMKRKTN